MPVFGWKKTQQPTALPSLGDAGLDAPLLALRAAGGELCDTGDKHAWPGSSWRPSACWSDVIATRPGASGPVVSRVAIVTLTARFCRLPRKRRCRELRFVDIAAAIAQLVARRSRSPNVASSILARRVRLAGFWRPSCTGAGVVSLFGLQASRVGLRLGIDGRVPPRPPGLRSAVAWARSSVVKAADCRSAGPWFTSGRDLSLGRGGAWRRPNLRWGLNPGPSIDRTDGLALSCRGAGSSCPGGPRGRQGHLLSATDAGGMPPHHVPWQRFADGADPSS
jgi:hypothetical protein